MRDFLSMLYNAMLLLALAVLLYVVVVPYFR